MVRKKVILDKVTGHKNILIFIFLNQILLARVFHAKFHAICLSIWGGLTGSFLSC